MKTAVLKHLYLLAAVIMTLVLVACSSGETVKKESVKGEKSLSFFNYENGESTHYQVYFDKKNKITSLYVDGKEIPESDYERHNDIIRENLNGLSDHGRRIDPQVYKFDFDNDFFNDSVKVFKRFPSEKLHIYKWNDSSFKEDMKRMREELTRNKKYFKLNWDDSTFSEDMKRMKEELAKLKDLKVEMHFDRDKLKIEMDKLRHDLRDLKINDNMKEMNESVRKMTDDLREKINIEIPDIKIELNNLDKEISKLRVEIKKIDEFMDDVRKELVKDKLIQDEDEEFSMSLRNDSMEINEKEIPSNLLNKYKDLYKKHFGREVTDSQRFEIR
jgi:hypothetical protein